MTVSALGLGVYGPFHVERVAGWRVMQEVDFWTTGHCAPRLLAAHSNAVPMTVSRCGRWTARCARFPPPCWAKYSVHILTHAIPSPTPTQGREVDYTLKTLSSPLWLIKQCTRVCICVPLLDPLLHREARGAEDPVLLSAGPNTLPAMCELHTLLALCIPQVHEVSLSLTPCYTEEREVLRTLSSSLRGQTLCPQCVNSTPSLPFASLRCTRWTTRCAPLSLVTQTLCP